MHHLAHWHALPTEEQERIIGQKKLSDIEHVEHLFDGEIVWAPAIEGAFVLTTRGDDFELAVGQDFSIGYLSHSAATVELQLQKTFTFRVLTSEAFVVLSSAEGSLNQASGTARD